MIVLNYKPRLKEIENTINRWSKQTLTPIGKNTIIKTLIISKLNHLCLAIPGPDENMIRQPTSKKYSFIWDDKPGLLLGWPENDKLGLNCINTVNK